MIGDVSGYSLYRIETPLGDYIGVSKNVRARFSAHKISKRVSPISDVIRYCNLTFDSVRVLAIGSREYIYNLESKAIAAFGSRWPSGLNIATGGYGCRDHLPSVRARMSAKAREPARVAALVARNKSAAFREKVSAGLMGRYYSDTTRRKLSVSHLGQRPTEQSSAKRSVSMREVQAARAALSCLSFGS